MEVPAFQGETTIQFTWTGSVAPNSAPLLVIENSSLTGVATITSQQSDSTHYWGLYTMPASRQYMRGRWYAEKTAAGSTYQFQRAFLFKVQPVTMP